MAKVKLTYQEHLEAKFEVRLTQQKKDMLNTMYIILTREHNGRDEAICADALAEEMQSRLGREINRAHVGECARIFRETGKFPGLQSCVKGYFVDNSYEAMMKTLRFVYAKSAKIEHTAENIVSIIAEKYGEDAVPDDLKEWLNQLEYEEWCEEEGLDPDEYEQQN